MAEGASSARVTRSALANTESTPGKRPRSKSAEARASLERTLGTLQADRMKKEAIRTGTANREKTEAFAELDALPRLKVVPKPVTKAQESAATHSARRAALARWMKARRAAALAGPAAPATAEMRRITPAVEESRHWRRVESKHDKGAERDYSEEEFCKFARLLKDHKMKWTEYQVLYASDKTRVPPATLR